jgi:enoyl-CoA hydratase/carnithine racemase
MAASKPTTAALSEEHEMSDGVKVALLPTRDGQRLGVLTLDSPASLNALSLPMIQALAQQLADWQDDDTVCGVLLEGAGEKAFCAGGDIRAFYHERQRMTDPELADYACDFFEQEYRLDLLIHHYPKPLICVADGICMGGGMGLFAGARFRLVTECSLLAMPEVSIGLYPDVGASWFLSRLPGRVGLWLGLTGARINGADALGLGLADGALSRAARPQLIEALLRLDWRQPAEELDDSLALMLAALGAAAPLPEPLLLPHLAQIESLLLGRSLVRVLDRLFDAPLTGSLAQQRDSCRSGSPLSRALLWRQYWQGRQQSLAGSFANELTLSVNCVLKGDFIEGVRALLIDKDKQPRWQDAEQTAIAEFYRWPACAGASNPLWRELKGQATHGDSSI